MELQENFDGLFTNSKTSHAPRIFLFLLAGSLFILLGKSAAMSQPYQPNEEVDHVHVNGNVYMLRSNSKKGNPNLAASIGEDGVLLVDASFAYFGGKLVAKLKDLGGRDVRFVVNTHWHAGTSAFRACNQMDRDNLSKPPILTMKEAVPENYF